MPDETTQIVTWRPMELDDISSISNWFWNVSDVALFDRGLPVPVSVDTLRETWRSSIAQASRPGAYWFMAERDGTAVGIAGLETVNYIQGDAVLPFFVTEGFRKRGLATAMTVALLDLAFRRLRLHRVTTFYRADNAATARVLEKIGFTEEGRFREAWFVEGDRKDTVIAGILGSEWTTGRDKVIEDLAASCTLSFSPISWNGNPG
ncbi:acetyltransferase [Roseobacter cerasinus]|uniref:Acetyltransferase n=1 Tax=Roseobacter cerasinus TaxID=2602289 RepID=A0A640VQW2_9RHOB|nr:GNAT family protein [Roseobacter cerasinus]GFE50409.1 acetyltransferase [Roseobacter cerasinus]